MQKEADNMALSGTPTVSNSSSWSIYALSPYVTDHLGLIQAQRLLSHPTESKKSLPRTSLHSHP